MARRWNAVVNKWLREADGLTSKMVNKEVGDRGRDFEDRRDLRLEWGNELVTSYPNPISLPLGLGVII